MIANTNLQRILSLSSALSKEAYADHIKALKRTIPSKLRSLIAITEQTPLNEEMRNLVEENVISSYKELLAEVTSFNSSPDQSKAKDLINWLRCEIEMGMLFFEGVYRCSKRYQN